MSGLELFYMLVFFVLDPLVLLSAFIGLLSGTVALARADHARKGLRQAAGAGITLALSSVVVPALLFLW